MTNGLHRPPYSADVWPGAPRELPPKLSAAERGYIYTKCVYDSATREELFRAWADIGQRLAAAMKEGK